MATSVELYEALKDKIGQRAAKMLADSLPGIDTRIDRLEAEMNARFDRLELTLDRKLESLRVEIQSVRADSEHGRADIGRLLLLYFLPLWVGVYGTLAAALLVTLVYRA